MCCAHSRSLHIDPVVALRPPLRVCEPFFKISFLALGSRSTPVSCSKLVEEIRPAPSA